MATSLTELINPVCIELDLKEKKKPDLIRELAEVLARSGEIEDVDSLAGEVLKREKISSTGIGGFTRYPADPSNASNNCPALCVICSFDTHGTFIWFSPYLKKRSL